MVIGELFLMRGEEVVGIVPGKQERLLLKLLSVCGLTKAFLTSVASGA